MCLHGCISRSYYQCPSSPWYINWFHHSKISCSVWWLVLYSHFLSWSSSWLQLRWVDENVWWFYSFLSCWWRTGYTTSCSDPYSCTSTSSTDKQILAFWWKIHASSFGTYLSYTCFYQSFSKFCSTIYFFGSSIDSWSCIHITSTKFFAFYH